MHVDLTSTSAADQQQTVARALELGAQHVAVGQRPEEGHVVLADPERNEFCVLGPGNRFLAGCGFLGALPADGRRATGLFWSAALGWPLVWDQDEETAIQSPEGGTKITWGGPPLMPREGARQWRLELVPAAGGDQQTEVGRLVSLGARPVSSGPDEDGRLEDGPGHVGGVLLTDPDGQELCVLPPR